MSQNIKLKVSGLFTNPNQLNVPDGALSEALNIVVDNENAESRRGFRKLIPSLAENADRYDRLVEYKGTLIAHKNSTLEYFNSTSWVPYSGIYEHPNDLLARMYFAQANDNLYFTTRAGVKMMSSPNGVIYNTGMPKGLDATATTVGSSGILSNGSNMAYRIVWGSRDDNNNLYLGSPSQRIIVSNSSGGTRDVQLSITIPSGITTDDFIQVYRSRESTTEPDDELQLCYEANPTSAEITARQLVFTDSQPVSMLKAYLYTNANQEGITEANDEPPMAYDICEFKGFLFYANVRRKHYLKVNLLSAGGTSGLQLNDTITINGLVFTAKTAENITNREFKLFTSGSVTQNIDDTARSLISVVNRASSNTTIDSYYETNYDDVPGQILFRRRDYSETSFSVSVSRATAFKIDSLTSSNEQFQNGLSWSKIQQPEHVPLSHTELIGSKAHPIRRILALRDALFILKDDGVFFLTGSAGSWSIRALDVTKIIAPDSARVVNNQIFCLADQGIVGISDTGVQILSEPIVDKLKEIQGLDLEGVKAYTSAVGYETDRKYILGTISSAGETFSTQSFVLNTLTNKFTIWDKPFRYAYVSPSNDKLYLCHAIDNQILVERKSFSYRDYVDEEIASVNILTIDNQILTLSSVSGISKGDLLYVSDSIYSPITEINIATNQVTVSEVRPWTLTSATILKAIQCRFEFAGHHCQNPGIDKLFTEIALLFKSSRFTEASVGFYTDLSGGYSNVPIRGTYGASGWGLSPWGLSPWGGVQRPKPIRVSVPRNKTRATTISIRFAMRIGYGVFSVSGLSIQFNFISERLQNG